MVNVIDEETELTGVTGEQEWRESLSIQVFVLGKSIVIKTSACVQSTASAIKTPRQLYFLFHYVTSITQSSYKVGLT